MSSEPDFYMKRNDQLARLDAVLESEAGDPIDLTGASVRFTMRSRLNNSLVIDNAAATVASAAAGEVYYSWDNNDTLTAGDFDAEFEIDYGAGVTLSVPNDGHLLIRVTEDLG